MARSLIRGVKMGSRLRGSLAHHSTPSCCAQYSGLTPILIAQQVHGVGAAVVDGQGEHAAQALNNIFNGRNSSSAAITAVSDVLGGVLPLPMALTPKSFMIVDLAI